MSTYVWGVAPHSFPPPKRIILFVLVFVQLLHFYFFIKRRSLAHPRPGPPWPPPWMSYALHPASLSAPRSSNLSAREQPQPSSNIHRPVFPLLRLHSNPPPSTSSALWTMLTLLTALITSPSLNVALSPTSSSPAFVLRTLPPLASSSSNLSPPCPPRPMYWP